MSIPPSHLPAPMRDSKLEWVPHFEGQASAPGPGDRWEAQFGTLVFIVDAQYNLGVLGQQPGCNYALELLRTHPDDEELRRSVHIWFFDNFRDACTVADALHFLIADTRPLAHGYGETWS